MAKPETLVTLVYLKHVFNPQVVSVPGTVFRAAYERKVLVISDKETFDKALGLKIASKAIPNKLNCSSIHEKLFLLFLNNHNFFSHSRDTLR